MTIVEGDIKVETEADLHFPGRDADARTHIVCKDELAEAIIFQFEIVALCGYRWVPGADPDLYPLCKPCDTAWARGERPCK